MFRILLLIIFCLGYSNLFSLPDKINLDEAITAAVKYNYEAKTAKYSIDKADQAVREAIGNALPSLSVNANYTRNLQSPVFFLPDFQNPSSGKLNPIKIGADNSFQTVANLNQIVFNSAVFTGLGTAKIYSAASREQYKSVISKTVSNVKKAFYGALLAREYLDVLRLSFKNAEENLKSVEALFREGFIPEYDKIRAEVAVENIRPAILQAENAYNNALNALKLEMGMNINEKIDLDGELKIPEDSEINIKKISPEELANFNFDLKTFQLQKQVSKDIIEIEKSDYYPTVALFGNYIIQGQSNTFDFLTAKSLSVGLNVSLSIFKGFQTDARTQQAKIDYMIVDERYNQLNELIKMQLDNSINQMEIALTRIKVQQNTVKQAELGYNIATIRYREGTGSQVEINDADTALRQARLNKTQAIYDFLVAKSDYESLIGDIDKRYFELVDKF